jgi:RNA polymerase III RPC4
MPGPPTQKGKFKPRKPAKKIHVGVTDAATVVPDTAPSSAVQPAAASAAARAAETGRGGRGKGREGRGRGRGRAPVPQGQVFFTATTQSAKKTKSAGTAVGSKAKSKADGDNKSLLIQRKDTETYEEVVGILDKPIGSEKGKAEKKSVLESYDDSDYVGRSRYDQGQEGGASRYLPEDGFTYDSDSSLEEAKPRPRNTNIPPTRLPFPVAPLPVGVGAKDTGKRPFMYLDQQTGKTASRDLATATVEDTGPSPFVDAKDLDALQAEMDSIFLFQFPTRLPALVPQSALATANGTDAATKSNNDATMEEVDSATNVGEQPGHPALRQTAEVVTTPIKPGSFDNTMAGAIPGRLGKLLVYKSGKTVLVFQGPNGSPEVSLCSVRPVAGDVVRPKNCMPIDPNECFRRLDLWF